MNVTSFSEANIVIASNYTSMKETLPEEAHTRLDEIVGDPILPAKVSHFLEFGYEYRDDLTEEQTEAVIGVGQFAYENRFYGLADNGKGYKMISVLNGTMTAEEAFPESVAPAPITPTPPSP